MNEMLVSVLLILLLKSSGHTLAAEEWALGEWKIHGPLGFTDLDHEGMLIEV